MYTKSSLSIWQREKQSHFSFGSIFPPCSCSQSLLDWALDLLLFRMLRSWYLQWPTETLLFKLGLLVYGSSIFRVSWWKERGPVVLKANPNHPRDLGDGSGRKFYSHCKEGAKNLGIWELRWRWLGRNGGSQQNKPEWAHMWFLSSGTIMTYMLILSWKQEAFDPCMRKIYVSSRGFTLVTVKKRIYKPPSFHSFIFPVLQYPLKEQLHLRMFILSWYSGLKSLSICFCPALDITFCRWQHLSESHCRPLTGFVPSEMGCAHHCCNFTDMAGMTPWLNLTHHHNCFLKCHPVLWAQWFCLGWLA